MSVIVKCDAEGCGNIIRIHCVPDLRDFYMEPGKWEFVNCNGWVLHACSEECKQKIKECEKK